MASGAERDAEGSHFVKQGEDVLVRIFAKPRASKSRIVKVESGELHIALAAPPVDGEANKELLKFLAKQVGLPKSRVLLEKGETSRHKVVRIQGVELTFVREKVAFQTG